MKVSASSALVTLAFAASVVSASAPDLATRSHDGSMGGSHPLVDRTFSWDFGSILGDFLSPLFGTTCSSGLFYWPGVSKCVKSTSTNTQPSTTTKSCPYGWTWSSDISCCKPNTKSSADNTPSCAQSGHNWLENLFFCALDDFSSSTSSSCDSKYQFWWGLGNVCCKDGGGTDEGSLPADTSCPDNWYYSSKFNFCLPKTSGQASSTTCSSGSWDSASKCCKVKRDSNGCDTSLQFWWGLGSFCIDLNHDTSGTCPDTTKSCPTNYSWSTSKGYCIPKNASACTSVGACTNTKHTWSSSKKYCSSSTDSNGCYTSSQFWWSLGSFCIDTNHDTSDKCPDSIKSCPNNYAWSTVKGFCVPNNSDACTNVGACTTSSHKWSSSDKYCKASTDSNGCSTSLQFWWPLGKFCLDNDHDTSGSCPDTSKSCPSNYSWSASKGFCIPKNAGACDSVSACTRTGHTWFSALKYCQPSSDSNGCSLLSQFWWPLGKFCLDNDHDTSGSCPDTSKSCPTNYSWSSSKGFCVPKNSDACGNVGACSNWRHTWWPTYKWCSGTNPSGRKRSARRSSSLPLGVVDAARCPDGGTACPLVFGSLDYECLKPLEEIESCGGCVTLGEGEDCTAITGAKSVGCTAGVCEVYKCTRGYTVGTDSKSCVPTTSTGSTAYLTAQARHAKKALI